MSMDEMVFGLAMVKEYVEYVNSGKYEEANKVYENVRRMN